MAPFSTTRLPMTIAASPKSATLRTGKPSFDPVRMGSPQRAMDRSSNQDQIALAPPIPPPSGGTLTPSSRATSPSEQTEAMPQQTSAGRADHQAYRVPNASPAQVSDDFTSSQQSPSLSGTVDGSQPPAAVLPPPAAASPSPATSRSPQPTAGGRGVSSESIAGRDRRQPNQPSDIASQLAEVKHYFERMWHPPTGLTGALEYILLLKPDGSVQQVQPVGRTAQDYLAASGIPTLGKPFISPIASGRPLVVRLVLHPDGRVNVSEETSE